MTPEYLKKIQSVDVNDPKAVVDCIGEYMNDDSLVPEQKLYAFGLLVNKNKDAYITSLQMKHENTVKMLKNYERIIAELKAGKNPKKKVVVIKKKDV